MLNKVFYSTEHVSQSTVLGPETVVSCWMSIRQRLLSMKVVVRVFAFVNFCRIVGALGEDILRCVPTNNECFLKGSVITLDKNKELRCSINYTNTTPWSGGTDKTAYLPENLDVNWYVFNNTRIALNISWSQKKSDLQSGAIEGYYLQAGLIKYIVHLDFQDSNDTNSTRKHYALFNYQGGGCSAGWFIRMKENIKVKVQTLPMHRADTKPQVLKTNITIPDCFEDERIAAIKEISKRGCRKFWEKLRGTTPVRTIPVFLTQDPVTVIVYPRKPDRTVYYALVCVCGAFVIIAMLLMMAYYSERNFKSAITGHRKTLMISETRDNADLTTVHKIAVRLRNQYEQDIVSNWENQEAIGQGSQLWYSQAMDECNTVLFIMTYHNFTDTIFIKKGKNSSPSNIAHILNYADNLPPEKKVEIVILITGKVDRIQSLWVRQRSRYTVYDTSNTFWRFLRHITGQRVSDKMNLERFLCTTVVPGRRDGVQEEEAMLLPQPLTTDLGLSLQSDENVDMHTSKNSIYENVEFSKSKSDFGKFSQTGAIPKQVPIHGSHAKV